MGRGSAHDLQRIAARLRRVRRPHEAGWPRRALWAGWQAVASLTRPAVFAGLAGLAVFCAVDGLRYLEAGAGASDRTKRVREALAAVAPDAAAASSRWQMELDAAMRPRAGEPPDSALAMSLLAAFEDVVGRERFSSLIWAEMHGGSSAQAESILRALPVWVRSRELESAWLSRVGSRDSQSWPPEAVSFVPPAVRVRLERTSRLYDTVQSSQMAFFAGHEEGALNLALLPGLAQDGGEMWIDSDTIAEDTHCAAAQALECALARLGGDRGAAQGARLLRAALMTGHATDAFRGSLQSADPQVLRAAAREIGVVARRTSTIDAIRLTAILEAPQEAARLRRLSELAGPRTLALMHFHGREALMLEPDSSVTGILTPAARHRFSLAIVFGFLAFGVVLAAMASALSVRLTGRAGFGQRLDLRMRELLLGRKV